MQSDLITKKLEELTELAKIEGEPCVQLILLAISGARHMGSEDVLAKGVAEILKTVLMPQCEQAIENKKAIQN